MPRTVAEIEAEIAATKAEKVHPMSARVRALRDELKAAKNPAPVPEKGLDGQVAYMQFASNAGNIEVSTSGFVAPVCDPYSTDEWKFIEKACAEFELSDTGNQSRIVKRLYQAIDAKLKVWRLAREIVAQVGIGKEWPQFSALGRDENTGQKVAPKPVVAPKAPVAPTVTEAGMPVRSREPSKAEILAGVTGGDPRAAVREQLAARTQPLEVAAL